MDSRNQSETRPGAETANRPAQPVPLILASASPRRAALLREAGYRFEVIPSSLAEPDESRAEISLEGHAESLAYFKAAEVARRRPEAVVLGADTICILGDEIINKADDRDHARQILRRLAGTPHRVVTGVALLREADGRRLIRHDMTKVVFRPLSPAQIEAYLETDAWRGKAGAYGVQDLNRGEGVGGGSAAGGGDPFVEKIVGSFTNVVGLPMELLRAMLAEWSSLTAFR